MTGSARQALEAEERAAAVKRQEEIKRTRRSLDIKRASIEAKIAALRADFEAEKQQIEKSLAGDERREEILTEDRKNMARLRRADLAPNGRKNV